MFKEFITAIKLARYGLQFKMQVAMAIIFMVLGVLFEVFSKGGSFLGGFYFILCTIFLFQLIISMDVSTLIQSSGMKRNFQLRYPYIATVPIVVVVYTIVIARHLLAITSSDPNEIGNQCRMIIVLSGILCGTIIYLGVTYKYMMIGSSVFCLTMIPLAALGQLDYEPVNAFFNIGLTKAVIIGYLLIVVGVIVSRLLMGALYRKNLSQWAFKSVFERELKKF